MQNQHLPQVSNTINLFSAIKQHNWGKLRHFVSSLSRCSVLALTFSVAAVGCTTHQNTALIHRRDASTSMQNFVEFVLKQEGRQILEEYGYAAIKP